MRTIYLIRHGHPDIPYGERWCVGGDTDLPLNPLGRMQASMLPYLPELQGLQAVFCSPLSRARETALPLCPAPRVIKGLEEQRMGVWDGLSFREIRERYSALYEARETDPSLLPDGAEPLDAVRARMLDALLYCLHKSERDIAVVSHRTALSTVIGHRELLLHASVSTLLWDGEHFEPAVCGIRPHPALTRPLAIQLLHSAAPGEKIQKHCHAVSEEALRIADSLPLPLNQGLLECAALLHDIARGEKDHACLGANWLRELGYGEAAALVEQHHDLKSEEIDEAAILYLADKCIQEERRVSLTQRFTATEKRCTDPEARAAHARRWECALSLAKQINALCGAEIIMI